MLYWVSLFVLGVVLSKVLPIEMIGIIVVGMILLLYYVPTTFFKVNNRILLIGILFYLMGSVCFLYVNQKYKVINKIQEEKITFSGVIVEKEIRKKEIKYIVKTDKIQEKRLKARIVLKMNASQKLIPGQYIEGYGCRELFRKSTNPGGFDEKSYQLGKGNMLLLSNIEILRMKNSSLIYEILYKLRLYFTNQYDKLLGEQNASLASAMVLGDKTNLQPEIKELYQRNGIAHLIAISGLHIAMIGGTLYHFIRRVFGSYAFAAFLGSIFIILYGIMTGGTGATLRAVIMLSIAIFADVFGRKYDMLTGIAFALFFMLIDNPFQIAQVGFLLSYAAVLGIAIIQPVWKYVFPKIPRCADGLTVSVSVQLILTPILLYFFYEIPIYGVVLNIVVIPLMSILLAILLLALGISIFSIDIAFFIAKGAEYIFKIYELLCSFSEELPFHTICLGRPSWIWIILYYILLASLIYFLYKKRLEFVMIHFVVFFFLLLSLFYSNQLKICMFDVGQGDSIYIQTTHKSHILIDAGSTTKTFIGKYILRNGLKYYGCNHIDYAIVTHLDKDHFSGIMELLDHSYIKIEKLVLPAIQNPDSFYLKLEEKAKLRGCKVYYMKKGDSFLVDDVQFWCLNPEKNIYSNKNQGSIVLHMQYKEFDALFTGDIDADIEKENIDDFSKNIEFLKVAHHGSKSSSCELFLEQVSPKIAGISVGEGNGYGHPSKEVLRNLKRYCKKIYLTKDNGAITIMTNGVYYKVIPYLVD